MGTEDIAERLDALSEEIAELALDRLREAAAHAGEGDPDPELLAEERRLTRARRAVDKATALLRRDDAGDD